MSVADATECKKNRGNARGQITRTSKSIQLMKSRPVVDYDATVVSRYQAQISKFDAVFHESHSGLYQADPTLKEDAYYEELDDHQTIIDAAEREIRQIHACIKARTSARKLITLLSILKGSMTAGYCPAHADGFAEIKIALDKHTEIRALDGIEENPCLNTLQDTLTALLYEVEQTRTDSGYVPASPTPRPAECSSPIPFLGSRPHSLAVALPTFNGKTTEFLEFKELFSSIIKKQKHLGDPEKKALLLKSMETPAAKEKVRLAIKQTTTFAEAFARLGKSYENCRDVVAFHANELLHKMPRIEQTKEDIHTAIRILTDHVGGLQDAQCLTVGQFAVAYMDGQFSDTLRIAWRTFNPDATTPPDEKALMKFLEAQETIVANVLVRKTPNSKSQPPASTQKPPPRRRSERTRVKHERSPSPQDFPPTRKVFQVNHPKACSFCQQPHNTFSCTAFKAKSPIERQEWAQGAKRCFNCLSEHHLARECKSKKRCQECNASHHSLLHVPRTNSHPPPTPEAVNYLAMVASPAAGAPSTAYAQVSSGRHIRRGRLLLDTGAEVTLVSQEFAQSLKATRLHHPPMTIGGVGSIVSPYAIRLTLHGDAEMDRENETVQLNARVLEHLPQPSSTAVKGSPESLAFLDNCCLADPSYEPGAVIDIILDSTAWHLCRTGQVKTGPSRGLLADSTIFGWVLGGTALSTAIQGATNPQVLIATAEDQQLNKLLQLQWSDPEMPGDKTTLSMEDAHAEQVFKATHRQLADNRHEVGMPTLENPPVLGESRRLAVSRYRSVERTMKRKNQWEAYRAAVEDFILTGHAEPVPKEDLTKPHTNCYYMPMHGVCKASSTTTKIRPVCDASAASSTGVSYNDTLAVGPCLYHPLPSILTRFRDSAIAMTADVSRMYRQVSLRLEDRDFHRFVFEQEPGSLADFRMTRVTFGVKASPFVATRVLQQIAIDQEPNHPVAAKILQSSFYVDDVLTGAPTIPEALHLRQELNDILNTGLMPLCKWRSNSAELLESIPPALRESSDLTLSSSPSTTQKALGVHWCTTTDDLYVSTPSIVPSSSTTKRHLVSATAQIYDPLGWLSPATITPRMFAQQAWKMKIGWDEILPPSILLPWQGWLEEMPVLTQHAIHRPYGSPDQTPVHRQLHGFSDASELGFGGAVYLRSTYDSGDTTVDLVTAKGKVTPIHPVTIPRLELKGAVVLAHLLQTVAKDLGIPSTEVFAWTDSMVVLGWLTHSPSRLAVYIGNRVRMIQQTIPDAQWHHVPGTTNPADCLSRGLRPHDLCQLRLWWDGPDWLLQEPDQWPPTPNSALTPLPELRKMVLHTNVQSNDLGDNQREFLHWVRITAWIRRFFHNLTHPTAQRLTKHLESSEYREAKNCIYRASQRRSMPDELSLLKDGKLLPPNNPLRKNSPFIDRDGLMKVGGRLQQSDLPDSAIHPIILHGKEHSVKLMVEHLHRAMLHPPMSAALATISFTFHIPRLKPLLKKITHHCMVCQRKWARPIRQKMGDLPSVRCTKTQVFANVGVDYAGPLHVTHGRGRGFSRVKAYVALFVCMATRAIHLELATDASTATFLAVLDRFCGRRGVPGNIYSDNGGNFRGANLELRATLAELHSEGGKESLCRWSSEKGIDWHFQPAYAPNHGGLWEAGVKTMKQLIRSTLHHLNLRAEELTTILVSAEAIMNSRPYLPIHSTDPDGLCPLTPGHFLVGRPLCALPQRVDISSKLQNVRHWELVKRLEHQHWEQFRHQFLPQLTARAKDLAKQQNVKINDVVLISDLNTGRNHWPLGIVIGVYPGRDGLVRAADIKVETSRNARPTLSTTIYRRSVRHLVRMPVDVDPPDDTDSTDSERGSMYKRQPAVQGSEQ